MLIQSPGYYDIDMTHSQLSQALNITLSDLEPFLLETNQNKFVCSINGFYKWISELVQTHTIKELQKMVSPIMIVNLVSDALTKEFLSKDVMEKMSDFAEIELERIFEEA